MKIKVTVLLSILLFTQFISTTKSFAEDSTIVYKGKLWNMEGPGAGAWDLMENKERFIADKDSLKDLINLTSKKDLPDFVESAKAGNSTLFIKTRAMTLRTANLDSVIQNYLGGKTASSLNQLRPGETYLLRLRNGYTFCVLEVTEIADDGKSLSTKGNNLDYISFEYKKFFLDLNAILSKGIYELNHSMAEKSLPKFSLIIVFEPEHFEAHYQRGLAKIELKDFEGAKEDFNKCIRLNNSSSMAYAKRGWAKSKLGERHEAVDDYSEAIKRDSNNYEAYLHRGIELYLLSRYSEAIADLTKAITISPNHMEPYYHRGLAKNEKGDFTTAIPDFTKAIELFPNFIYAYFYRGFAKTHFPDSLRSAEKDYTKVIELDPVDKISYYNRGHVRNEMGRFEEAMADFEKAISLDANYEAPYLGLAFSYFEAGDISNSELWFNNTISRFPLEHESYYNRAIFYSNINELEKALNDLTTCLKLKPDDGQAFLFRGDIKIKLKDKAGACADYQKSFELGYPESEAKVKKCSNE